MFYRRVSKKGHSGGKKNDSAGNTVRSGSPTLIRSSTITSNEETSVESKPKFNHSSDNRFNSTKHSSLFRYTKYRAKSNDNGSSKSFGTAKAKPYQRKIFALMKDEDWTSVRKLLSSDVGKELCFLVDDSGLSLLGAALGSRAPRDIVEEILEINPDSVFCIDEFGATPLHVGCLNGMSSDLVQMIFDIDNGQSAKVTDRDNRTALHHAVELSCFLSFNYDDSSDVSILFENSLETLEILLSVAPETVHYMTSSGHTALDMPHMIKMRRSIEGECQIDEIYRLLKETSILVYRRNKLYWEENSNFNNVMDCKIDELVPSVVETGSVSASRTTTTDIDVELWQMQMSQLD